MEILQFLLNFFSKNSNGGALGEILNLLSKNNYDVKKVLSNLTPQTLEPIIKSFMNEQNKNPSTSPEFSYGITPIARVADKDIVYTLNKYFGQLTD